MPSGLAFFAVSCTNPDTCTVVGLSGTILRNLRHWVAALPQRQGLGEGKAGTEILLRRVSWTEF